MQVGNLGSISGWEDPLEEGLATHSSILAWRIPWTEEPGGLWSMGRQRVGQDWETRQRTTHAMQKQRARRRHEKKREEEENNGHIFNKVSDHFTKDDLLASKEVFSNWSTTYKISNNSANYKHPPKTLSVNDCLTFQNTRGEGYLSFGIHMSVRSNFLANSQEENNKVITIIRGLCFWSKEVLLRYFMKSRWEQCPSRQPVMWVQKPQGDPLFYRFPPLSMTPTSKSKWHGNRDSVTLGTHQVCRKQQKSAKQLSFY